MKEVAFDIMQTDTFKNLYRILAVFFFFLALFITISPDPFEKFGYMGVFAFNALGPGLLIIPSLTEKMNPIGVILSSALGNSINTSISYIVGSTSSHFFTGNKYMDKVKRFMKKFTIPTIYVLAIIPLPLDLNGLLSGYLGVGYKKYILVNFLGKITQFSIVALGFSFPKFF